MMRTTTTINNISIIPLLLYLLGDNVKSLNPKISARYFRVILVSISPTSTLYLLENATRLEYSLSSVVFLLVSE
jgi:hypothetical protein